MKLGSGSEAQEQTRSQIIQIFRYLQALNQVRNPPQRSFDTQAWTLWFHDLPDHPCVRRGIIIGTTERTDAEKIDNDDEYILKDRRPSIINTTRTPTEKRTTLQH